MEQGEFEKRRTDQTKAVNAMSDNQGIKVIDLIELLLVFDSGAVLVLPCWIELGGVCMYLKKIRPVSE